MRLAYVNADRGVPLDGSKGASIHVRAVASALARRGHDVSLLTAAGTAPEGFAPATVDVGFDRTLKNLKSSVAQQGQQQWSRELHSLLLGVRVSEELEARHRCAPIDAVYERYSLWSWAGLRFCRLRDVPFVLEVNAPLVAEQARYRGLEMAQMATAVEQEVMRGADLVLVPSQELARHVCRSRGRKLPTEVMPNAVDLDLFLCPPPLRDDDLQRLEGRFVVAFTGSLKPWHGVELLVEAFRSLCRSVENAHLLIIGDGPERSRIESACAELGDQVVTFTGAIPHRQVASWLSAAQVGVAPYPALDDFYFSPLKVVEYQASGLAVVASRIGQLAGSVVDGETGLLVEPGDPQELAHSLLRLHRHPKLVRELGRKARKAARRCGGWDRIAERIEEELIKLGVPERAAQVARLEGVAAC